MSRNDQALVAHATLTGPGWARVGITAPNDSLPEDAAYELARTILDSLAGELKAAQVDQLKLAL